MVEQPRVWLERPKLGAIDGPRKFKPRPPQLPSDDRRGDSSRERGPVCCATPGFEPFSCFGVLIRYCGPAVAGILSEIKVPEGATVEVNTVVAVLVEIAGPERLHFAHEAVAVAEIAGGDAVGQ